MCLQKSTRKKLQKAWEQFGAQGIAGLNGKDGKDGTTYTPSIGEVTTVDSNELASASVSVNTETKEAVFNFAIPKGKDGIDGTDGTPVGCVLPFAGINLPIGYLSCNGASYKVTDYPDLYAVIGNTYGGDTENFNVPNLVDKFIQGSTTSGTEKEAGLPNITGRTPFPSSLVRDGAFYFTTYGSEKFSMSGGKGTGALGFDASLSSSIYGKSTTVQPPAVTMVYIIKAK